MPYDVPLHGTGNPAAMPPPPSFSFFAASGGRPADPAATALGGTYAGANAAQHAPPPHAQQMYPNPTPQRTGDTACITVPSSPFAAVAAASCGPVGAAPSGVENPIPNLGSSSGDGSSGGSLLGVRSGDPRAAPPGNAFGAIGAPARSSNPSVDTGHEAGLPPSSAPPAVCVSAGGAASYAAQPQFLLSPDPDPVCEHGGPAVGAWAAGETLAAVGAQTGAVGLGLGCRAELSARAPAAAAAANQATALAGHSAPSGPAPDPVLGQAGGELCSGTPATIIPLRPEVPRGAQKARFNDTARDTNESPWPRACPVRPWCALRHTRSVDCFASLACSPAKEEDRLAITHAMSISFLTHAHLC